jgi:hypothetical protein
MRPHLVITASVETLAGVEGAEPAELEGAGPIANETLQLVALAKLLARPQAEPRGRRPSRAFARNGAAAECRSCKHPSASSDFARGRRERLDGGSAP